MSLPNYLESLDPKTFDLSDHSTRTKEIVSLNVAFMVIVVLVTGVRLFVRICMKRAAGLDDFLIALAAICTIGLCSICIAGAHFGLGIHIWNLGATNDYPLFLYNTQLITKSLFGGCLIYATAITLTKCSIIASYLRIFPNQHIHLLVYCTGSLIAVMWCISMVVTIMQCQPIESAWNWQVHGECLDVITFFYVSSSINIATDLLLWIAPLPLLWKLKLNLRERLLILVLFSFGFFACVSSILRLTQLHGLHSNDITYDSVPVLSWSVAEVATGIVCASIPAMRPLAVAVLPKSWLETGSSTALPTLQSPFTYNLTPESRRTGQTDWEFSETSVSPQDTSENAESRVWLAQGGSVAGSTEKSRAELF